MYCKNCGTQIDDSATSCPSCGAPTHDDYGYGGKNDTLESTNSTPSFANKFSSKSATRPTNTGTQTYKRGLVNPGVNTQSTSTPTYKKGLVNPGVNSSSSGLSAGSRPTPPRARSTSSNSIASTENKRLAIIGLVLAFLMPFVGLICSGIAYNRAKKQGLEGKGLALAGIIIVVLFISVAILVSITR